MLSIDEINFFINEDNCSDRKNLARVGERYYEGEHDILRYRLFFYDANGDIQEDKTRSNIKISHPFFTELVDQQAQYMLNGEAFVKSDIPELQEELDKVFNDDFTSELTETITSTITKGFGYMYCYKDVNDNFRFENADAMGVVEVRAKDTDDNCKYVIYWYIDKNTKEQKKVKRIQVWDDKQIYFYVQTDDGAIVEDDTEEYNPRPHIVYRNAGDDDSLYYDTLGFVPFFRLDNNRKQQSSLKPIKALIDDYDLMACGLSNNIQDSAEAYFVVSGFQGDNLDELIQNVKVKKHIGVDVGGGIDVKTVEIPYQARATKLALDETNIYRFGMGFNSAQLGDGNITNVVIKSRYALLDLKCDKLEKNLKKFLREMIRIVLDDVNKRNETDYQLKDVYFEFNREIITNATDNAQIKQIEAGTEATKINLLLGLNGVLDNETVIQLICEQLDIDYNDIKDKLPQQEATESMDAMEMLEGVEPEEVEEVEDEEVEGISEGEKETQQAVLDMLDELLKELDN